METTQVTPIYSEGKVVFASPTEAIDTQLALLNAGFAFESTNQQPRPNAYGVMWRREWVRNNWKMSIFTAGTEAVFKAYGAHRKESIYNDGAYVVNNAPGRRRVHEIAREQQAYAAKLVQGIVDYLHGLGYNLEERNTKKGKPLRAAAWTAFIHLLKEANPRYKPYQVRRALCNIVKSPPEWTKLNDLARNARSGNLEVSEVLNKL